MIWISLALIGALCDASRDLISKASLKNCNEYIVSWGIFAFGLPFVCGLALTNGIPIIKSNFYFAVSCSLVFNLAATVVFFKALKAADLSLTIPLISLTPFFMLFTSPLIVGETANFSGWVGVIFIVVGTYLLPVTQSGKGYLAPLVAIIQHKGTRLMLYATILRSFCGTFDKVAVSASSATFYGFVIYSLLTICLLPLAIAKSQNFYMEVKENISMLTAIGFLCGLGTTICLVAFSYTLVPYVIAVKRLSVLFAVLGSGYFLKEKETIKRSSASAIMICGIIIIAIL